MCLPAIVELSSTGKPQRTPHQTFMASDEYWGETSVACCGGDVNVCRRTNTEPWLCDTVCLTGRDGTIQGRSVGFLWHRQYRDQETGGPRGGGSERG